MNEENDYSPEPQHFDDAAYKIANATLDADVAAEFSAEELVERASEFFQKIKWEAQNRASVRRFGV